MTDLEPAEPPTYSISGQVIDGRVWADLAQLIDQFRRRAVWWREQVGELGDDELTEEQFHLAVVGHGIATELEDRADQLDVAAVQLVSAEPD